MITKIKIAFYIILTVLLQSCKTKFPKSQEDCIKEAKYILNIISKPDYIEKLDVLKKYETFKTYQAEDFKKSYGKLNDTLQKVMYNNLKITTSTDVSSLHFANTQNSVKYFEIIFSADSSLLSKERSICLFRYSIADNENHYVLSYFKHNLNPKVKPILPKKNN